ncbi:DUF4238 domain-containing protein [Streptomyces liangshanensis]|uniref:DUF4238 domain-containing protein n=1 Tax=Streptomyces liangshanensis TaxID=2717324 RepID=UPI0036DD930D
MTWELISTVQNPWGQVPVSGHGQSVVPKVAEYMARVEEAAKRRNCVSRRHHYVPQAYMRAWSEDGKRVRVLDIRNGIDKLRGLRDTCVRENFYQITTDGQRHNQVEAMLAVIDDETARLLKFLRAWKPGDDMSFEDFMSLAVVLAFQRNRTPQVRRHLTDIDTWTRHRANQVVPELTTNSFVQTLFRSTFGAADEHSTRQLELWDDPGGRFITSDQPVQLSWDRPGETPSTINSEHLLWPISPHRLVVLSQDLQGEKIVQRTVSRKELDRIRGTFIRGAETAIIALPHDGDLPSGKNLRKRPQLRTTCTPIDTEQRKCRIELGWGYGASTLDETCQPLCAMKGQAPQSDDGQSV